MMDEQSPCLTGFDYNVILTSLEMKAMQDAELSTEQKQAVAEYTEKIRDLLGVS